MNFKNSSTYTTFLKCSKMCLNQLYELKINPLNKYLLKTAVKKAFKNNRNTTIFKKHQIMFKY